MVLGRGPGAALVLCFAQVLALGAVGVAATDMYCGDANCYDVLGLAETASSKEVKKAYRRLSLEHHPDRKRAGRSAAEAESADSAAESADSVFISVAAAYEVLSDEKSREDYDYYLAHPEEHMYNQFAYYSRAYRPKTDPRMVALGLLLATSAMQFLAMRDGYRRSAALPAVRARAVRALAAQHPGRSKWTAEEEEAARAAVLDALHEDGTLRRPSIGDVLLVTLVAAPLRLPGALRERRRRRAARDEEDRRKRDDEAEAERRAQEHRQRAEERGSAQRAERQRAAALVEEERAGAARAQATEREEEQRKRRERETAAALLRSKVRGSGTATATATAAATATGTGAAPEQEQALRDADFVAFHPDVSLSQLQKLAADFDSDVGVDAAVVALRRLARKAKEKQDQSAERRAASGGGGGGGGGSANGGASGSGAAWSESELASLSKATKKYPGGARNRWLVVANFVNSSSKSAEVRSPQECADQAKKLRSLGGPAAPAAAAAAAAAAPSAAVTTAEKQADTPPSRATGGGEGAAWSQQEQKLLEQGIARFGRVPDVKERWRSIAALVPGRSAKQCAQRFKVVRAGLLQAQAQAQAQAQEGAHK